MILLALLCLYFILLRRVLKKTFIITSILVLALCFFSPLYILSAHYLFSAHMIVHVFLLLWLGPVLLISFHSGKTPFHRFFLFFRRYPVLAWIIGVGLMWFWHVPAIFNSAMGHMHVQGFNWTAVVESVSLIIGGMIFSAPVIHPDKNYRVDALSGVVYLFTACIGCSLLGLLITFAPAGTYHHFLSLNDQYGINELIVRKWGMTQVVDQQAAGLIMWVPCCLIYVSGAMYLLVHWYRQKEEVIIYSK